MLPKDLAKLIVPAKYRRKVREYLVSRSVTHLHGPKGVRLAPNEAAVTCVVKNGDFYIERFIEHYTQMGFRHIFFLDNGSTDKTISIAKRYSNVSVCHSRLPIDAHQGFFKKYLAQKSIEGGWCLDADVDEFFDYPFSDVVALGEFLKYLNKNEATAVLIQLLDMFSDQPLSQIAKTTEREPLHHIYRYYDISNVTKTEYRLSDIAAAYGYQNEITNRDTALQFGGIRRTLYGNDCLLTKHSLFSRRKALDVFPHVHFVNNARLSDVSCVVLHYKLAANALDIAIQNKTGFVGNSKGYSDFIHFLTKGSDCQIKRNTSVKLRSVNELVENGFLFISPEYLEYVRTNTKNDVTHFL
jgi:glycosyltransferase involved in cell wall biosynthesis